MKPTSSSLLSLLLLAGLSLFAGGCGRQAARDHDHAPGDAAHPHRHEHTAPHGGTVVVLGDEAFHLEFVRDTEAGKLTAYVLDGELENFIRIAQPGFEIAATVGGGRSDTLAFRAVANQATGETAGDTSQFEAQAEWLKTTADFNAVLSSITVRGTTFSQVNFNFPKGNETE